jgi:hypothetical protein
MRYIKVGLLQETTFGLLCEDKVNPIYFGFIFEVYKVTLIHIILNQYEVETQNSFYS